MGFAGAPRAGLGTEGASSFQRNHLWRDNVPGRENLSAQTLSKAAPVLNYLVIYMQDDFWVESLLRHPGLQFSEVLLVGIVTARHFFLPEEHVLPLRGPKRGAELPGFPQVSGVKAAEFPGRKVQKKTKKKQQPSTGTASFM